MSALPLVDVDLEDVPLGAPVTLAPSRPRELTREERIRARKCLPPDSPVETPKGGRVRRACYQCGKWFTAWRSTRRGPRAFCSRRCVALARNARRIPGGGRPLLVWTENGVEMRRCVGCGPRPLIDFPLRQNARRGGRVPLSRCVECDRKRRHAQYLRERERARIQRARLAQLKAARAIATLVVPR